MEGVYLWPVLWLKSIRIQQFKNCREAFIPAGRQINCFWGKNGAGKTAILDAIYYLSFTKSYFTSLDAQHISHDADWMSIEGEYERNGHTEKVRLFYGKTEKKSIRVNNNELKKFSDHIGAYPLVMITPNDILLIHEGSEDRRKFLDGMISQTDKSYLADLLTYNRTLEQRNKQLKLFAEQALFDPHLLESFNDQLVRSGERIFETRKNFLHDFVPVFRECYQTISSSHELVNIDYECDLSLNSFANLLTMNSTRDLQAQRTTKGIHKDELGFMIDGYPLRKYGSQGQQKSFIIALKLAQYTYLTRKTGIKPLLLLDDIFEKLDAERLEKLLHMIAHGDFGQLFITDTHYERLRAVFEPMEQVDCRYFHVEEGTIRDL